MCDTGTDTGDYFLITASINAAHGSTLWLRIVDAFLRWAKIILHIPLKITVIGRRIEVVRIFLMRDSIDRNYRKRKND